jgi:tetratricopeptide (TPR) repeat protein
MRSILCSVFCLAATIFSACGGQPQPASNSSQAANANPQSAPPANLSSSHSPSDSAAKPPSYPNDKQATATSGGEAIDTSQFDAEIERAQKQAGKKGSGESDRQSLAHAYLARANALTKARQYRAALGDYRRTLKYDPDNQEARQMSGTIISILQSMKREVPAEGAEPTPLPYKK